jgi:formylglycine-generating enzyme required for sulfatase activity
MRKLRVFLCHASQDKPVVRELYARLKSEPWIDPWLDEENLFPGQDFDLEIYRATRDADAIIICLSKVSVAKEGYVNKEIRRALDIAQERPEGAIYVIPLRLDDCTPSFEQLKKLQWVDYFTSGSHERLLRSLRLRAELLKIEIPEKTVVSIPSPKSTGVPANDNLDLYRFIKIPPTEEVPYSFYIGKYPVTNAQYERFLNAPDFADKSLWVGFPKYDENCIQIGKWGSEGWGWLLEKMKESGKPLRPKYWNDENFGVGHPDNPIVGVTWYESNAYCIWLRRNWNELAESRANLDLQPVQIRLPLDFEWSVAAGGEVPEGRYPWDMTGKETKELKEIIHRANVGESNIGHTTPVNAYLRGASPFGVMDMTGNIWEWQSNAHSNDRAALELRGGSWFYSHVFARVARRELPRLAYERLKSIGFRVVCIPK